MNKELLPVISLSDLTTVIPYPKELPVNATTYVNHTDGILINEIMPEVFLIRNPGTRRAIYINTIPPYRR